MYVRLTLNNLYAIISVRIITFSEANMKRYTRLISLILVMALLVTAFASCDILKPDHIGDNNNSGGNQSNNSNSACQHFWIFGVCRLCNAECDHEWGDGICKKCDCPCKHLQTNVHPEGSCEECGEKYKKAAYRVALAADFASAPECDVYYMDIAMSIDELCAHLIPTYLYIFRREALNVYVDSELVTDFSTVIDKDAALTYVPKREALTIGVKVENVNHGSYDIIYLPSGAVTLEMLGALLYPTSGGVEHLFEIATVSVNGVEITDPAYTFTRSCGLTISMKNPDPSVGGDPYMSEEITVTLICEKNGEKYENKFYRYELVYLSEAITRISPYNLSDMLEDGYVFVNGEPLTHVSNDVRLGQDTEIIYREPADGMLKFSFRALVNPPDFEYKDVFIANDIEPDLTYEQIVNDVLGMTWEEYEDKYFNTSHSGIEPGAIKPKPIYRDTVISENVSVAANYYMDSEIKETVTLNLQFGYGSDYITVPYNTPISEVLADLDLDIDKCITEYTVYFNIYHLLSDARLRFDSMLYIGTNCPYHSWSNRKCTLCGARCYQAYYADTNCTVCGSYHPSGSEDPNNPKPETVKVSYTVVNANGTVVEEYVNYEIPAGTVLDKFIMQIHQHGTDKLLDVGSITVNGKEMNEESAYLYELVNGDKIIYTISNCSHTWQDGKCTKCEYVCYHNDKVDGACTICGQKFVTVTIVKKYGDLEKEKYSVTVLYESSLIDLAEKHNLGGFMAVENGMLYVNGEQAHFYQFTNDCEVWYVEFCNHTYENGICSVCTHPCEHSFKSPIETTVCGSCGISLIPLRPTCIHVWNSYLSMCGRCGINASEVAHFTVTYNRYSSSQAYQFGSASQTKTLSAPIYTTLADILVHFGHMRYIVDYCKVYVDGTRVTSTDTKYTQSITISVIISQSECKHLFDNLDADQPCAFCGYECPHAEWDEFGGCTVCTKECRHPEKDYDRCAICGCYLDSPLDVIYCEKLYLSHIQTTFGEFLTMLKVDYDTAMLKGYFACLVDGEHVKIEKEHKFIEFLAHYEDDPLIIDYITY